MDERGGHDGYHDGSDMSLYQEGKRRKESTRRKSEAGGNNKPMLIGLAVSAVFTATGLVAGGFFGDDTQGFIIWFLKNLNTSAFFCFKCVLCIKLETRYWTLWWVSTAVFVILLILNLKEIQTKLRWIPLYYKFYF